MTTRQFKAAVKKMERAVVDKLEQSDDVYERIELLGSRDAYRDVLRLLKSAPITKSPYDASGS